MTKLITTILCGGVGSRLWPISRESHPKPFIRLSDGESLLQKAFARAMNLSHVQEVLTVTNRELFLKIQDEFRDLHPHEIKTSFILEPFGRNTAPAIAAASLWVNQRYDQDAILLVLAADHLIENIPAFEQATQKAIKLAEKGKIVAFGIRPNFPETGYGYIEFNNEDVVRFIEKPSLEKAQEYIASTNFLWNSGIFCFSVGSMIKEMKTHCPDILELTNICLNKSHIAKAKDSTQLELDNHSFAKIPENSIDYAIMERSDKIAVVPCDIGWSDIGSWTALGNLAQADTNGNRIQGEVLLHNTHDCTIQSDDRLIGMVGVKDLIVIDTLDAILIANKNCAQDVKHIYAKLKAQGHEAHKIHKTVHRPWGTYTVLEEGDQFKIKRIEIKPGESLSLQMHHHRSEHWIVVNGMAKIINGEQEILVNINESTYIPAGHKHRVQNPGLITLIMIEVQSGTYLGEDDIVRFEDNYGRI
jgi:mannose-1-phosphate guanylyltransferase